MDVLHTALDVSDYEPMRRFYEEILDLATTREYEVDGTANYYFGGESDAEIQLRVVDGPVDPKGIDHVAVASDDVDGTVEAAMENFDVETVREPVTIERKGIRLGAVTDPEGYTVHLIENIL